VLALLVGGALPSTANAARVGFGEEFDRDDRGRPVRAGTFFYATAPGERNDIRVSATDAGAKGTPRTWTLSEGSVELVAGVGCRQVTPNVVTCSETRRSDFATFEAMLGDLDDRADVSGAGFDEANLQGMEGDTVLVGGTGRDTLLGGTGVNRISGGGGEDDIVGGAGNDVLHGGDGPDQLAAGTGADVVMAGGGDDRMSQNDGGASIDSDLLDGGAGSDATSYDGRDEPVAVTLGDGRPDGSAGEGDRLPGVEGVTGGRGRDRLVGDRRMNLLDGGGGRDLLFGRGGRDILMTGHGVTARCGGGRDLVVDPRAADRLARDCERVNFPGKGFLPEFETFFAARAYEDIVAAPAYRTQGSRSVSVLVSCGPRRVRLGPCRGRLVASAGAGRGRAILGRGRFLIRPGRSTRVVVALTPAGRRALARGRPLSFSLRAIRRGAPLNRSDDGSTLTYRGAWTTQPARRRR